MTYEPTPEQAHIIELARTGENLVVQAGAGVGKSTVLRMIAQDQPDKRFLYLAFNRTTVRDATQSFPSNVNPKTSHALAMASVGRRYAHRLNGGRQPSWQIAKTLGMGRTYLTLRVQRPVYETVQGVRTLVGEEEVPKVLQPGYLAGLVIRSVKSFCQTADLTPGRSHIPWVSGIDFPRSDGVRSGDNNNVVRDAIEDYLDDAWTDVMDTNGSLPYDHNYYLKAFHLSEPVLDGYDVILFDEGQDANPCTQAIVAGQKAQLIVVGDSQQAIYGWNGARDALQMFPEANVAWLTQSWRFGQAVAEVANEVLGTIPGADLRLSGNPSIDSQVGRLASFDAYLARTNAHAVVVALDLIREGTKVAFVGGADEVVSFARAAERLMGGKRVEHPDLAWAESWDEVLAYVETDELGADLKMLVGLVVDYGVDAIIHGLGQTVPEDRAEVIVSTCHKAKGREFGRVVVGADFPDGVKRSLTDEEKRLLYVSVTRARFVLDISRVAVLNPDDEWLGEE